MLFKPAIAQLLQIGERKDIKEQKKHLRLAEYDWVFYPISDRTDPMEGDGGIHWSLMIHSKKENKYFHFDPLEGLNGGYAQDLMTNLLDRDSFNNEGQLPIFNEASCGKTK